MFSEFLSLVPETNQFYDILNKIFRKKIKRAKVGYTNTTISSDVFGGTQQKQPSHRRLLGSKGYSRSLILRDRTEVSRQSKTGGVQPRPPSWGWSVGNLIPKQLCQAVRASSV